jgi:hypothetical protein
VQGSTMDGVDFYRAGQVFILREVP